MNDLVKLNMKCLICFVIGLFSVIAHATTYPRLSLLKFHDISDVHAIVKIEKRYYSTNNQGENCYSIGEARVLRAFKGVESNALITVNTFTDMPSGSFHHLFLKYSTSTKSLKMSTNSDFINAEQRERERCESANSPEYIVVMEGIGQSPISLDETTKIEMSIINFSSNWIVPQKSLIKKVVGENWHETSQVMVSDLEEYMSTISVIPPGTETDRGKIYYTPLGETQDRNQAIQWLKKSIDQGNKSSLGELGDLYRNLFGVTHDYENAIYWYKKAAENNDSESTRTLGFLYSGVDGVEKNYEESFHWFNKAANLGDGGAFSILATYYLEGLGVEKNDLKAKEWLSKAASLGYAEDMNNFAWFLATTENLNIRNGRKAIEWAKKAVEETDNSEPMYLDTLAVAYASVGEFENAIKIQNIAIELLINYDEDELSVEDRKSYLNHLELFKNKKQVLD